MMSNQQTQKSDIRLDSDSSIWLWCVCAGFTDVCVCEKKREERKRVRREEMKQDTVGKSDYLIFP